MPLSPDTLTVLSYWEQVWFTSGRTPSAAETLSACRNLSAQSLARILRSEDFQTACANRGIDALPEAKLLAPEQLALANTLLDLTDTRTPSQKLKALGISPRKYSAWQKQAVFRAYLARRAEDLFGDALPEAHTALMRNVQQGDLASIKLFYEISGRWSSKTVGELNVEFLMMKIIDILTRRLSAYPEILTQIADDLSTLAPGPTNGVAALNVETIPGIVEHQELEF
jgi:hypothetical protein